MVRSAIEKIFEIDIENEKKLKYFIRSISHIKEQRTVIDELRKEDVQQALGILKELHLDRRPKDFILIVHPISKIVKFKDIPTEHLKSMLELAAADKSEKNLEKWLLKRYFEYFISEQNYTIETPDSMFVMIKTILSLNDVPRSQAIDIAFDLAEKRKILEEYQKKITQKETPEQ